MIKIELNKEKKERLVICDDETCRKKEIEFYNSGLKCKKTGFDIVVYPVLFIKLNITNLSNKIKLTVDTNPIDNSSMLTLLAWRWTMDCIMWCYLENGKELYLSIPFGDLLTQLCEENKIEHKDGKEIDFYFKVENLE